MFKLVVNPDTGQAWEIPLAVGPLVLGSDSTTSYPIAHESVAAAHCEVVVSETGVVLRDLGEGGGTFVDTEPIHEANLTIGQRFQLGQVELLLLEEAGASPLADGGALPVPRGIPVAGPIRVGPATGAAGVSQAGPAHCKYHPRARATWTCSRCQANYCDLCVASRRVQGGLAHFCRRCGEECTAVQFIPGPAQPAAPGFGASLPGAFRYPFQGNGLPLLIAGALCLLLIGFASRISTWAGPYGFVAILILGLGTGGYLFAYAKSIVTATAGGEDAVPNWPELSDPQQDILQPFGQLIALLVLTFGPFAIVRYWHPGSDRFAQFLTYTVLGLGALLAPMGILALAVFDSVAALNPVTLMISIGRLPLPYLVAAVVFEFVTVGYVLVEPLLLTLLPVPVLAGLIADFLSLYLLIVGMRILGLLYRTHQDRLGWA